MEKLFTVDFGLMVWTVCTFLLLVGILGRFGWGPLIAAIEAREAKLREEREAAEKARAQAAAIQADLEQKLAQIDAKSREALAAASKEGEAIRADLKKLAEVEAQKIKDKTAAELAEEKRRLVGELRKEVAELSVLAAEKLLRKSVDDSVQKGVLDTFFKELEGKKASSSN